MNNKKIFLAAVIASIFILSAFLITVTADTGNQNYTYIIQPHEDTFAVFEKQSKAPIYVFENQKLADLPATDQENIRNGLKIRDESELAQRIEDYDG